MGDSYRPSNARRPPSSTDRITFTSGGGGGGGRRNRGHNQPAARNTNNHEFSFRNQRSAPQFPPAGTTDNNSRANRQPRGPPNTRNGPTARRQGGQPSSARQPNNFSRGGFHSRKKPLPHERPLFQQPIDDANPEAWGVQSGSNRYRNLEDMSDDNEIDMDLDSGDSDAAAASTSKPKVARTQSGMASDGNSVPKWSNPDPYTALPPPPSKESKDVVKMIRSAKITEAVEDRAQTSNAVAANDDFIAFDEAEDKAAIDSDSPPLPPWHSSSSAGYALTGSLNDAMVSPVMPTFPQITNNSVGGAGPSQLSNHQDYSKKRKRTDTGISIVGAWVALNEKHATPWTERTNNHKRFAHEPYKWLHNEIIDFYDFVKPHDHERTIREGVIYRTMAAIGTEHVKGVPASVQCFGSFPANLFLPTADMDLVYISDQCLDYGRITLQIGKPALNKIAKALQARGVAANYQVISKAKVPIIKFTDLYTGLPVDISFEKRDGLAAQRYFKNWAVKYPDMNVLVALVKQFLLMRDLNEVKDGGLGGFSTVCLVVNYLHRYGGWELDDRDRPTLAEIFLGFLWYYGTFDLAKYRLVMEPPGVVLKGHIGLDGKPESAFSLSIQDPNKPDNNISGGSHKVRQIFAAFKDAHAALKDRMDAIDHGSFNGKSILGTIIGGNYNSYKSLRERLHTLASQSSLPEEPEEPKEPKEPDIVSRLAEGVPVPKRGPDQHVAGPSKAIRVKLGSST